MYKVGSDESVSTILIEQNGCSLNNNKKRTMDCFRTELCSYLSDTEKVITLFKTPFQNGLYIKRP